MRTDFSEDILGDTSTTFGSIDRPPRRSVGLGRKRRVSITHTGDLTTCVRGTEPVSNSISQDTTRGSLTHYRRGLPIRCPFVLRTKGLLSGPVSVYCLCTSPHRPSLVYYSPVCPVTNVGVEHELPSRPPTECSHPVWTCRGSNQRSCHSCCPVSITTTLHPLVPTVITEV